MTGPASDPRVRVRSWVQATAAELRTGLIAYVSVSYGEVVLDGLTARRTAAGALTISYPDRRSRGGRRHAYIRPIDDRARRRLEKAIFAQVGGAP